MDALGYGRYGLSGNPFRDLSSDGLDYIEVFHVNQNVDDVLRTVKDEVLYKENRAVVAVMGSMGIGKTHRLRVLASEGRANGAFVVYENIVEQDSFVPSSLVETVLSAARLSPLEKLLSAPKWYKALSAVRKPVSGAFDAERVGHALSGALNANAPSFLLLNDIHNLPEGEDTERLFRMLHVVVDNIDPGVLVMLTSETAYYDALVARNPSLGQRVNKRLVLRGLDDDEAGAMLAKRMLGKRMVEDLEDLYPFSQDAVEMLNTIAVGNPRALLKLADQVLEHAVARRSIRITEEVVQTALEAAAHETLPLEEVPPVLPPRSDEPAHQASIEESFSQTRPGPEGLAEQIARSVGEEMGMSDPPQGAASDVPEDAAEGSPGEAEEGELPHTEGLVHGKCPKCKQGFDFEMDEGTTHITCPHCGYKGKIRK